MNKLIFGYILVALSCIGVSCQDEDVSYLDVSSLNYPLNVLTVVSGLTVGDTMIMKPLPFPWAPAEFKYKVRIKNNAPWIAAGFFGATVEGARPIVVTLEGVKAVGDKADGNILKQELKIIGEGKIEIPLYTKIPVGEYLLSLQIANISGSQVVPDAFTVIVTDKK